MKKTAFGHELDQYDDRCVGAACRRNKANPGFGGGGGAITTGKGPGI